MGGMIPAAIFINGKRIRDAKEKLKLNAGSNPFILRYDSPGRGHFVLKRPGSEEPERIPLSMSWWNDKAIIPFDVKPDLPNPVGWYRFTAPPGLASMKFKVKGSAQIWINGEEQHIDGVESNGGENYLFQTDHPIKRSSTVAIRIKQYNGFYGGSAIPEPILLDCKKGIGEIGDWSQNSALECYSGGVLYGKNISMTKEQVSSIVMLDLGKVVATAGIWINGKKAGVLVSPPWKLDISEFVHEGDNRIEIRVFNTLANHYSTIPTRYRGDSLESGLIGPVKLNFSAKVELREE